MKFVDGSGVRARGARLVSLEGADLTAVNEVLAAHGATAIRPLFSLPEAALDATRMRAEARAGQELADLNLYFRIRVGDAGEALPLVEALLSQAIVEVAYVAPHASPPPSFVSRQGYRDAAPVGIDVSAMVGIPGATGANVKVTDIEYGWDVHHEDLAKAQGALIPNGTPRNVFSEDHGTAVLGQLIATPNDIGITGLVPDARLGLVNADTTDGYMLANAIMLAANASGPGDVILIEQQHCNEWVQQCVPSEWIRETYDAIRTATAAGIVVVEAAGNGDVNLDQFGTQPFPRGLPDSGAIIVGAGETPNCTFSDGPTRSRTFFSTYGRRVDLQGWGECVVTTGYGDLVEPSTGGAYTASFSGTSSAAPIVAAAAASLSSAIEAHTGAPPTPADVRRILRETGTPQDTTSAGARPGHIGPMPDLARAFAAAGVGTPVSGNLLLNPGFELDANGDTRPDAWSANAKFTRSTAVAPRSGTYSGRFQASDNTSATSYQQFSVQPGASYAVGGWLNAPSTADAFTFDVRAQWRTSAGTVISTQTLKRITDDTGGAWQAFAGSLTAPGTASVARIVFAASSLAGAVHVDDMRVERAATVGPTASFTASQTTGSLDVRFTDTSTGTPTGWQWSFGDSTQSSDQHPTHTFPAAGTYQVTLTATNAAGSNTTTQSVTVAPLTTATNLLLNGSFEQDSNADGRPDGWTASTHFSRSATSPHGGTYAGQWQSTANNGPSSYQQVNVTASAAYVFSGWWRAPTTADAFTFTIKVSWRGPSGAISTQVVKKLSDDTAGAWQQVGATLRAPTGATLARVQMVAGSLGTTIFVDDFAFAKAG